MPHFKFPDEYVYWTYIEDHIHVKRELLPIILDIMKNGCLENPFKKCTMKTTITQNYKLLNRDQGNKVVFEPIMKMISEMKDPLFKKIDMNNTCVTTQWFNIYEKGDFQELHEHLNNGKPQSMVIDGKRFEEIFSVVYILHDKSNENSLVFKGGGVVFDTSNQKDIHEGCVLIFPSSLKHEVKPVTIPGRITFAFNVAHIVQ
jgi:predicted 2-oxoglutarate/Fe(II)-dependent dioxygenase YbiX|tara:strand:+ start:3054 stop:3659 length:606 start_codon:yes stop_codon:yes gene_type:complete